MATDTNAGMMFKGKGWHSGFGQGGRAGVGKGRGLSNLPIAMQRMAIGKGKGAGKRVGDVVTPVAVEGVAHRHQHSLSRE